MTEASDYLIGAMLIGAGATLVLDLWTAILRRCGLSSLDYALVGRWFAYMTSGIFRHHPIAASPAVRGERLIGWSAHYLIGVVFAGVLLACGGLDWICHPTILPALTIGIGSVLLPFLLMQPGMGAGIAASRTPRPAVARLRSLVTHGVFGLGLYATGWIAGRSGVFRWWGVC